jgi:hypothetical protein
MKARFLTCLGVLSLTLGTLTSCSDAIFATIETEKKVVTNTLPLLLSIFDIASPSTGNYYVAAGAVYQGILSGPNGTLTWTPNTDNTSRPFNPPGNPLCTSMALLGANLFGGFITTSGNASLYKADVTFSFSNSTPISMLSPGEQITLMRAANGNLFIGGATASGASDYVFQLDYSTNGTAWNATSLTGLTKPIAGVGYDTPNGDYWAASGTTIYRAGTPDFASPTLISNTGNTDPINGLFVDSARSVVFVATKTNGIFFTKNRGVAWTHIAADVPQGASKAAPFLTVTGPVDDLAATPDKYLVGSDGFGYYTLSLGAGTVSRFSDTTILLYTCSVSRILVENGNVLMGTNLNGLWRAVFDRNTGLILSGTNQYWIHE